MCFHTRLAHLGHTSFIPRQARTQECEPEERSISGEEAFPSALVGSSTATYCHQNRNWKKRAAVECRSGTRALVLLTIPKEFGPNEEDPVCNPVVRSAILDVAGGSVAQLHAGGRVELADSPRELRFEARDLSPNGDQHVTLTDTYDVGNRERIDASSHEVDRVQFHALTLYEHTFDYERKLQ